MPQTEQQVCAVLVSGHLSPAECLALFQCSKSLAVTILHNAQCVSLTLRGHPAQPATDSASESPTSSGAAGHAPGSSAGDTNGTALANGARPSSNGHAEPDCSQVRGKAAGPGPHSGAAACADGAVPKAACKRSSEGSLPRRDAAQQGDQRDHQVSTAMRLACHASSITLILDAALPPIPILPELVPRVRTVVLRRMRVQPDALVETLSALCSLDLAPPVYTPSGTDSDTSSSFTSCASSSTAAGRGRFGALVLEQCQIITPPGPPCTPHNATVQHHSTDDAPSVLSSLTGQTSNVKGLGVGEGADRGAEYGQGLGQEKSEEGAARRIRMGRLRLENCAPTAALAAAAAAALATSCLDTHTLTDVELELHPTLSHGSPDEPRSDHIAAAGAAGAAAVAANAPPLGAAAVAVGGPAVLATAAAAAAAAPAAAAALSPLSALPALRRLRICGFSLSDAALSWLFTHPSLEYACVDGLLLAVNEDHHLKRVSALRELELSQGCHVASLPLPELARVCVKSCLSLQVEGLHKLERALSKVSSRHTHTHRHTHSGTLHVVRKDNTNWSELYRVQSTQHTQHTHTNTHTHTNAHKPYIHTLKCTSKRILVPLRAPPMVCVRTRVCVCVTPRCCPTSPRFRHCPPHTKSVGTRNGQRLNCCFQKTARLT